MTIRFHNVRTVLATDLQPGDVVVDLHEDNADGTVRKITVGRARVDSVRHYTDRTNVDHVSVDYWYSSRQCGSSCYDDPIHCPHMNGSAGGGGNSVRADQPVRVYTGKPETEAERQHSEAERQHRAAMSDRERRID